MSPAAAQLQFGAEFLGFLAAIAGVALSLLRAAPRRPPPAVAVAFAVLAGVAFASGARLVDERTDLRVAAPRLLAAGVLAVAVVLWKVEGRTKLLLLAGAVATGAAVPLAGLAVGPGADAAVAAGGLFIGAAVLDLARRSVASRIAVSGGLSLLVIVLVLSVALSAVVDTKLRDEAVKRLNDRATAEATAVTGTLGNLLRVAGLAKEALTASVESVAPGRLAAAAAPGGPRPNPTIEGVLGRLSQDQGYLYLAPDGSILGQAGVPEGLLDEQASLLRLVGDDVVAKTGCQRSKNLAAADVVVLDDRAYGTVAVATCSSQDGSDLGRLVALVPLDDGLLRGARTPGEATSLALFGSKAAVAQDPPQPDSAEVRALAVAVLGDGQLRSATVGGRFVSVAPVRYNNGRSLNLALAASSPTAAISDTRDGLFQALFAIALLGTLVALLLAAVVGERIGARLRSLTQAAAALGRGDPGVRTGLTGDDEVGTLGATFDVMASAIEDKTEVEGRLRSRLEAVVGGMGEALVATDGQARITEFNRSAENLVGISAATARGRQVYEVVSLTSDDGVDLASRLKQPPRNQWSATATLTPLDGPAVPVAVTGAALRSSDDVPGGGVFVLRDLRGEREVERMKTEFLSRIGHELRTPLTGVLGYTEMLLRRSWPPDRSRQMLEEVNSSGHRLERIVQLLEFFAAAAAGRTLLRLQPVDLKTVVDDVVKLWEPRVQPPLVLSRKVARGLPTVLGDPRWLRLALSELVDNALKFSPAGGTVVISAVRTDDGRVDLAVSDRGVGMTPQEVDRAFTDFEQGDTSDTRRYGGLGLGLPLVLRVVEGHGGEVRCATTPGRGTRLSMVLPAR
ncbi:MAG: ATP-binding protein [Acidimicrobiales bacterium]